MTIRTDRTITSNLHAVGPWLVAHPRRLQALLDLAFLVAAVATFGQVWDPDVLFHVIWVVLTLQAFLFGLRLSIVRIAIAGLLLLAYFNLGNLDTSGRSVFAALDLAEHVIESTQGTVAVFRGEATAEELLPGPV